MVGFTLNREETYLHPTLGRHGLTFFIWMGNHVIWPRILNSHTACPTCRVAERNDKHRDSAMRAAAADGDARRL
jgi:hypothetical protein